jgi:hypothetical protein
MSADRLDIVDTFDQFGHDHWKALGTKLGGVEVVKAILRGTSAVTVDIVRRLTSLTSFTVATTTINPYDFFKTREGLWMSDDFNDLILSGTANINVSADETAVGYADLAQAANDAEIGGELPDGHVFEDVDKFRVHLAKLIEGKWGGKEGALLNNGCANIFYVKVNGEVFAVRVYRHASLWGWNCDARRLDDNRWFAGSRAFSATAA